VNGVVNLGRYSTLGDGCFLRGAGRIDIGPCCSIGPEVVMISENHAFERFTTFPLALYADAVVTDEEFVASDIQIGADVWVGQRAIILAGASIPTGCVVGAGSVVTRGGYDPFTVLAGVPARPIRKRLDNKSRETLLASEWWEASSESIFREGTAILKRSCMDNSNPPEDD
jgi:virginiamycin A acetyltransferase